MTYLHKIDPANHPAANCPLCNDPNHDSLHLFNCPDIPTTLLVWDLWTDPVGVAALLDVWGEKLGGPRAGVWDPVHAHAPDGVDTTTTTTKDLHTPICLNKRQATVRCGRQGKTQKISTHQSVSMKDRLPSAVGGREKHNRSPRTREQYRPFRTSRPLPSGQWCRQGDAALPPTHAQQELYSKRWHQDARCATVAAVVQVTIGVRNVTQSDCAMHVEKIHVTKTSINTWTTIHKHDWLAWG